MPKVEVSAITINLYTFECIDLVGSMLMCVGGWMYMYLHACMQGSCLCGALLWFSSEHIYSFYSCPLGALENKICIVRLNSFYVCV